MDDLRDAGEPVDETELAIEGALRPTSLAEFVGQQKVRGQLQLLLDAARIQQRPADHILLSGPPGLGKTTLAMIVAHESARPLRLSSGPAIQHAGDLAALLSSLTPGRSAVHRRGAPHGARRRGDAVPRDGGLPHRHHGRQGRRGDEHPARPRARSRSSGRPPDPGCCPIRCATASASPRTWSTTSPRSSSASSSDPPRCSASSVPPVARAEIARRSRGTPRIANRLLRRVRDYLVVLRLVVRVAARWRRMPRPSTPRSTCTTSTRSGSIASTAQCSTCSSGGSEAGPVGLSTLAVAVGEEPETIESVVEPYLVRIGFMGRTPRGRIATPEAYAHLGRAGRRVGARIR